MENLSDRGCKNVGTGGTTPARYKRIGNLERGKPKGKTVCTHIHIMRRKQYVDAQLRWKGGSAMLGSYHQLDPTAILDVTLRSISRLDLEALQRLLVADKSMREILE